MIRAARQMGAIGTGPTREALTAMQDRARGPVLDDYDAGYSVAMIESSGERTFASARGALTSEPEGTYESVDLVSGDVICLSGYSFLVAE